MSNHPSEDISQQITITPEPCCTAQKPLRVAGGSPPKKVAGAIAGQIREAGCAELHAVGPDAVNQTVKSIALAKSYLSEEKIALATDIDFMNVEINGAMRNGLRFCVRVTGQQA